MLLLIAIIPLVIWLYLLIARGAFWRSLERDDARAPAGLAAWPRVAVVIPARNEAEGIEACIASLLRQDYRGDWSVILVDDDSTDATAELARSAAAAAKGEGRFRLIPGAPLAAGWTGKLWAMRQGVEAARAAALAPDYLLLTDADIVYEPHVLTSLVARAEREGIVLVSLMVKLRCKSFAERALIPAFIFFFQMLYPFSWVNRAGEGTAAAAGGCMLVRADTLYEAGGIEAIRTALIDDCALARLLKARGRIWLGLTERVHSIRPYPDLDSIRHMVARTAYAQLQYSPLLLVGTVLGMIMTYLVPVLLTVLADGAVRWLGLLTWVLMALAFQPTLRLYRLSPLWGFALPAIALCYTLFTIDSAVQSARGKGGLWKGRVQATLKS